MTALDLKHLQMMNDCLPILSFSALFQWRSKLREGFSRTLFADRRRFLEQRIVLAERFGPHIPFVVILGPEHEVNELPFTDLTLTITDLPSFSELKSRIRLNPQVQKILKDGDPGKVNFLLN